jgi:hypothetical protein
VLAAAFKALGISRWLIAMPALAEMHAEAGSDAVRLAAIEVGFVMLNEYAGAALGEMLGVGLLTGLWLAALAVAFRHLSLILTVLLGLAGALSLLLPLNEFLMFAPTSALQGGARTLAMLGQIYLAVLILRAP